MRSNLTGFLDVFKIVGAILFLLIALAGCDNDNVKVYHKVHYFDVNGRCAKSEIHSNLWIDGSFVCWHTAKGSNKYKECINNVYKIEFFTEKVSE